MAKFQESDQELMEGKDVFTPSQSGQEIDTKTTGTPQPDVDDVNMDTSNQTDNVSTKEEGLESDDKESQGKVDDQMDAAPSGDVGKKVNDTPDKLPDQDGEEDKGGDHGITQDHQAGSNEKEDSDQNVINNQENQSQADQGDHKHDQKGDREISQDGSDQGENDSGHEDNQNDPQADQSGLKEASESDQESPQSNQEGSPVGKIDNQSLDNKPEQTSQNGQGGQGENDHEISDQMDANLKPHDQNANAENANSDQDKIKTDQDVINTGQDKAKSDQNEVKGSSTPPHTQSASADSQATEIIDNSESNTSSQGDEGDDEDQATPDASSNKGNKQPSSDEEQYDRPWYKFWGSNDTSGKKRKVTITRRPSVWSARDTVAYRNGYPGKKDNKKIDKNLKFYRNEIPSYPHGDYIDVIHEKWWGDYEHLEYNHSYIQWLFPIREQGLNMYAEVLQLHEAEAICSDPVAHGRLVKSYKMMLDFYGMRLSDEKTGDLERAVNWKERFHHLNHSMHNYLRITRILKCLGEMQLEHLKTPFVRYVLYEIISEQTLYNCLNSCINYWLQVIRNDEERAGLLEYAESLARETHSTAVKSQAGGQTKKDTEPELKKETQSKKVTQSKKKQSKKGKQQKDKSQTGPKKPKSK